MNHRDRVLAALRHEEPDRVPIDFGGTVNSTISAMGYQPLRQCLGLRPSVTQVEEVHQYMALIEEDVRQALGVDVMPVFHEPMEWRREPLADGSPADFPARFRPLLLEDGSQVVLDAAGNITLKMPQGGYYFDRVYSPLADATSVRDIEKCLDQIENYDKPTHLDRSYEALAEEA